MEREEEREDRRERREGEGRREGGMKGGKKRGRERGKGKRKGKGREGRKRCVCVGGWGVRGPQRKNKRKIRSGQTSFPAFQFGWQIQALLVLG